MRKNFALAAAVLAGGLAGMPAARGQTAYQFTTFDVPGAAATDIRGISGNLIVGDFIDSQGTHGFVYNGSTVTTLNGPSGTRTLALGVSGTTVVGDYLNSQGIGHGFVYNGSTVTTFDDPLGVSVNAATAISGNTIVGTYNDASNQIHSYIYNGNGFNTFDAPVAGSYDTEASGVSGGVIVGNYISGSPPSPVLQHGFIYDGTTFTTLDDPMAQPIGISRTVSTTASGVFGNIVVGDYSDMNDVSHGFIYSEGSYTTLDDPLGVNGTIITGIDGSAIVGYYLDSNFDANGFIATPVPEPASVSLICVGTVLLLRRRNRR